MWKFFVSGLIAGAVGSMYIFTKLLRPHSCAEVVADGAIGYLAKSFEAEEDLEKYTLSDEEFERMWLLTRSFTYFQNGSVTAKWN